MATETTVGGRGERFGRGTLRIVAAGIVALLVLGATLHAASARTVSISISQHEFVQSCKTGGGTSKSVGIRIVQCTLPSGTVVTCDFNTNTCTVPFTQPPDTHPPIGGGVLTQGEAAPSDPGTHTVTVDKVNAGAVFVTDDDQP
jgi:hypothetical protein